MKLKFKGKITNIHHDLIKKRSKIYLNHGKSEVLFERPMTKRYEWKRLKQEGISSGDFVEVCLRKIK